MKKDFFALLGRNSTKKILGVIDEHEHVLYRDLLQFSPPSSLKRIVKDLLDYDLIKRSCSQKTTELELTGRGRMVIEALRELAELLKSEPEL